MPTVHIRIVELLTKEKHSTINSLHVLARTNEFPNQVFKLKIYENKYSNILSGDKSSSLFIRAQQNNYLFIDLKRYHLVAKDDLIGQLVLPLEWFPTNHIVREWFPIKKEGEIQVGMILLDIHVDNRNALPFMAPFAALRVFPCWERPTLGVNCEIPVIPPIVYIISSQPSNTFNHNQEQNLVPQVQEYVDIVDMPVNPYSIHDNKKKIDVNHQNFDNNYNQQTENQQIQKNEQKNQNIQQQQHFQIYSIDVSDDENEQLNNENQYEQQKWQQSMPEVQQFTSVYYPKLTDNLYN